MNPNDYLNEIAVINIYKAIKEGKNEKELIKIVDTYAEQLEDIDAKLDVSRDVFNLCSGIALYTKSASAVFERLGDINTALNYKWRYMLEGKVDDLKVTELILSDIMASSATNIDRGVLRVLVSSFVRNDRLDLLDTLQGFLQNGGKI